MRTTTIRTAIALTFTLCCACAGEEAGPEPPPERVGPRLAEALAVPGDAVEIDVAVEVPRFTPAPIAPMNATFETRGPGEAPRYTLDGRAVDAAAMEARAVDDRALIVADLRRQFAARTAAVEAAIADAGVADAVVDRRETGFRVRLTAERARAMLATLGPRVRMADLPETIETVETAFYDATHELDAIGVLDFAHPLPYDMKGQGVGIWHVEGNSPNTTVALLDDADIRLTTPSSHWEPVAQGVWCRYDDECCSNDCGGSGWIKTCQTSNCPNCMDAQGVCKPGTRFKEHSTMVSILAHKTAPDATLYHSYPDFWTDCLTSAAIAAENDPPVYVGTQSWSVVGAYGNSAPSNGSYNVFSTCSREWDEFIVSSRIAHFASAGNSWTEYVGFPGRSYNVTAVGQYEQFANGSPDDMTLGSSYFNPSTGVEKPEILGPGVNVQMDGSWWVNGTSAATPIVAGFAADMMSGSAFFKNQPQAIRAYLIAGAHNVEGAAGMSPSAAAGDGAGRVDYLNSYYYRSGEVWAGGGNDAFFVNNKITRTVTLTAGKRYTAAIAWLADGGYAYTQTQAGSTSTLHMRLKLTLARNGVSYSSYEPKNNFQLVDFTAPSSGTWTITIERMFDANVGGVDLALTVGEHG